MCEGVNGESVFWGKRAAPGGLVPVVVVGLVAMRLEDCLFYCSTQFVDVYMLE